MNSWAVEAICDWGVGEERGEENCELLGEHQTLVKPDCTSTRLALPCSPRG